MRAKWVSRMLPLVACWVVGAALWFARPSKSLDAGAVETTARVHADRTVRVDGLAYEVDAALVGEVVTLRVGRPKQGGRAEIWHHGRSFGDARVSEPRMAPPAREARNDVPGWRAELWARVSARSNE